MVLADNIQYIFEKFDFTESIITEVKWENNLFDLSVTLDYWWNLDDDPTTTKGYGTKILKLTFVDCIRAIFNQGTNLIDKDKKEIHPSSWYTVVSFRESLQTNSNNLVNLEIITLDYDNPWLRVQSRGIKLERI